MKGDAGISKIVPRGDEGEEESGGTARKVPQTGLWLEGTNTQTLRFYI